jgi:uncharacterized membrane protein YhhN
MAAESGTTPMQFGILFWPLLALGAAAAAAYGLVGLAWPAGLAKVALKTAFMASLAAAFWGAPPPFFLALAFSALGDLLLAFDKKWTLGLGILCFLLAQLCYAVVFFALWMFSGDNSPLWPRYAAMIAMGVFALVYFVWLWPKLGLMALGVGPYTLAICAMAFAACWLPWQAWPAMLGALLFVISDGVLAAELFRLAPGAPERAVTGPVVWWTYAAAQGLIVWGVSRGVAGMA